MLITPQPSDAIFSQTYDDDDLALSADLKKAAADSYLDILLRGPDAPRGSLLEIGCGAGDFLCQAAARGLQVTGIERSPEACAIARSRVEGSHGRIIQGDIMQLADTQERFDYVVFCDVLDHVRDPRRFLQTVFRLLRPEGTILCVAPSLDSWTARFLKTHWREFKPEHLFYFSATNLRSLLFQEGFSAIRHFPARKTSIAAHFEKHPAPFWMRLVRWLCSKAPEPLLHQPFMITASGIGMVAKKKNKSGTPSLSVIMPAYNEAATIRKGIEKVLNKTLRGVDIELILVESNSRDGTREIIRQFDSHPRVRIIFEEVPRGKGHAVRAGLAAATGDFVLIQDADDEYDIEDYDALIEPLLNGREAFVLGARHSISSWKMRQFDDQPVQAFILNMGHWFFATLVNVLYGVRLRDPFTMYKVFRRDCISGLTFECNRFDFDYELLIKLIRRGFKPVEIPVNYRSRSFAEGKKINILTDPWTWLKALVKFRFVKI